MKDGIKKLVVLLLIVGLGAASFAPGSVQAAPSPAPADPVVGGMTITPNVVVVPALAVPVAEECPAIIADSGGDLTPPIPDDTAPVLMADSGGD